MSWKDSFSTPVSASVPWPPWRSVKYTTSPTFSILKLAMFPEYAAVSAPRPPSMRSSPPPPISTLSSSLPIRVSLNLDPVAFSMCAVLVRASVDV